ncbi:hypothetical protein WMF04_18090 [Sorangium sp. So ce260]|uniref:hypothetical protein n=1 Tax=Sorangium sp. So ce260 TaxID=3133291 RepID=UPI003F623FEE
MRLVARDLLLGVALSLVACAEGQGKAVVTPAAPSSAAGATRGGVASSAGATGAGAPGVAGAGAPGVAPSTTPTASSPQVAGSGTVPATARVVVTGVVMARGAELEICPGEYVRACAGLVVEGALDAAFVSTAKKPVVVRVPGVFDGARLRVDGAVEKADIARPLDFNNRCPEFQQRLPGGNPTEQLQSVAERIEQAHPERFAGKWWDRERQTLALWLTGDVTALKREIQRDAPGARLCVLGNARYSQRALETARARADAILAESGVLMSSSSEDTLGNRVVYNAEAIDPTTLERLRRELGDAVRVVSFIELRDGPLATLPQAPRAGDIPLVTSRLRSGVGMAALGRFSVHLDAEQRCVYLQDATGRRVLPVWPFGYSATRDPFAIRDFDGNVVARPGATLDFGGGMVDVPHIQTSNTCGAQVAWVGQPSGR